MALLRPLPRARVLLLLVSLFCLGAAIPSVEGLELLSRDKALEDISTASPSLSPPPPSLDPPPPPLSPPPPPIPDPSSPPLPLKDSPPFPSPSPPPFESPFPPPLPSPPPPTEILEPPPPPRPPRPPPRLRPPPPPPPFVRRMIYHGGEVMWRSIRMHIVWYGMFTEQQKNVVRTFVNSLRPSPDDPGNTLSLWWNTVRYYTDLEGRGVSGDVRVGNEVHILGPDGGSPANLTSHEATLQVVVDAIASGRFPLTESDVYVMLLDPYVEQTGGYPGGTDRLCIDYCAFHRYANVNNTWIKWFLVGNGMQKCKDYCISPIITFWIPPNRDSGLDAQVNLIAHEFAETATNPFPFFQGRESWFWREPNGRYMENADGCSLLFGPNLRDRLSGKPRNTLAWNQVGLNNYRYVIQMMWDRRINQCVENSSIVEPPPPPSPPPPPLLPSPPPSPPPPSPPPSPPPLSPSPSPTPPSPPPSPPPPSPPPSPPPLSPPPSPPPPSPPLLPPSPPPLPPPPLPSPLSVPKAPLATGTKSPPLKKSPPLPPPKRPPPPRKASPGHPLAKPPLASSPPPKAPAPKAPPPRAMAPKAPPPKAFSPRSPPPKGSPGKKPPTMKAPPPKKTSTSSPSGTSAAHTTQAPKWLYSWREAQNYLRQLGW